MPDALLLIAISVLLASVGHEAGHDLLEVLGVLFNLGQLQLGISMSLVEIVVVLRLGGVADDRVLQDCSPVALAVLLVVLAVEAFLLDVFDGHQDLGELGHVLKLLRLYSFGLGVELNLLDLDLLQILFAL